MFKGHPSRLNDIESFETLQNMSINVVSFQVGNILVFVRVAKEDTGRIRLYLYYVVAENEKHWHGFGMIQGFLNLCGLFLICVFETIQKQIFTNVCDSL